MQTSDMQTLQFHGQTGFSHRLGCLLAAAFLLLPSIAFPEDEFTAADYRKSDNQLNGVYQATIKKLDSANASSLKNVQRAWIAFKEQDFALLSKVAAQVGDNNRKFRYMVEAADAQSENLQSLGAKGFDMSGDEPRTSAEADQLLNKTYKYCIDSLPPELVPKMQEIEVLWITFRDLQRRLKASFRSGATDDEVLRQLTMRRVVQLRHYIIMLVQSDLFVRENRGEASNDVPLDQDPRAPNVFRFAK